MRYAVEPIGYTKTAMREGKWNHTKIFQSMEEFDSFAKYWEGHVICKAPAAEMMLIPRSEIEYLVEDTKAQAANPMVAMYVKAYKTYEDMIYIARSISGGFIIREFA